MTQRHLHRSLLFAAALAVAALAPGRARAETYGDRLVAQGNDYFRVGNYFRASESYRCAVLEEPADGQKKLAFGHSLFALGNYAYAAYSFRRGVQYMGYPDDLHVDLAPLFPSRSAFDRAMRDVRRYAQYYPGDPHALTTIAYASYFAGDAAEAEQACRRLLQVDARDPFAAYILRRIERERGGASLTSTRPAEPPPVPATLERTEPPKPPPPPPPPPPPAARPAPPRPAPPVVRATPKPDAGSAVGLPPAAEAGERMGPRSTLSQEGDPRPALAK
jgi:tetratricopeptide (TPR) repeat protein